jgi:hypothetical protein
MLRALVLAVVLAAGCAHPGRPPPAAAIASTSPPAPPGSGSASQAVAGKVEADEARFAELVRRAEAGEAVDFREMRLAWLHGPGMKPDPRRDRLMELRREMFAAMRKEGDPAVVLAKAREILDIVYVDLEAQNARRHAFALLHEAPCAQRGRVIAEGLIESMLAGGDGVSCATAWKVITVDEEYFVLRMMGATLVQQSVVSEGGNTCDALDVEREGRARTLYFEISEVLAAIGRRLGVGPEPE